MTEAENIPLVHRRSPQWDEEHFALVSKLEDELGHPICGAKSKKDGGACKEKPVGITGRCKKHGGKPKMEGITPTEEKKDRRKLLAALRKDAYNKIYKTFSKCNPCGDLNCQYRDQGADCAIEEVFYEDKIKEFDELGIFEEVADPILVRSLVLLMARRAKIQAMIGKYQIGPPFDKEMMKNWETLNKVDQKLLENIIKMMAELGISRHKRIRLDQHERKIKQGDMASKMSVTVQLRSIHDKFAKAKPQPVIDAEYEEVPKLPPAPYDQIKNKSDNASKEVAQMTERLKALGGEED